jgi:hypothetical protein
MTEEHRVSCLAPTFELLLYVLLDLVPELLPSAPQNELDFVRESILFHSNPTY